MQVGEGAQILAFDAAAMLTLSDGTSCELAAPASHVRAKGYKLAVPSTAVPLGATAITYTSMLDASSGAVEN